MKTPKTFDCVDMQCAAQRKIREQVQGMTAEEEIAFFRAGSKEFERSIEEAKRASGQQRGKRLKAGTGQR